MGDQDGNDAGPRPRTGNPEEAGVLRGASKLTRGGHQGEPHEPRTRGHFEKSQAAFQILVITHALLLKAF